MKTFLFRVLLPALILLAAVACAGAMIMMRPRAERTPPTAKVTRVMVMDLEARSVPARVVATGVVQPARQVTIVPEVGGRIVWQSDDLIPGGRLTKGETFARIDSRDYELAVEQARSAVKQAELELELERGRQRIAEREWTLLGKGRDAAEAPLALRKPQLQAVEQALASARSGLEKAEINLQRASLRAPFNAQVLSENIDPGQVVGPQSTVATLIGTDQFRVQVSIPVEQLPMVQIPGVGGTEGSSVVLTQRLGQGGEVVRSGRVLQLLGQLDPQTRTAQLLIGVDNPLDSPDGGLPLLQGAYVDVEIEGRTRTEALWVPRNAVYDGTTVWVVEDDSLVSRTIDIGWREAGHVVVTAGLSPSARLVTSPLALPVEGMPVSIEGVEPAAVPTSESK